MRQRVPADLELMKLHVRALFKHDDDSRMLCVNEPDNAGIPAPRLFLGRTRGGNVWRFRADLPKTLIEELEALCADEPAVDIDFDARPRHVERYVQLLEQHAAVKEMSAGPAYHFTEDTLASRPPLVAMTPVVAMSPVVAVTEGHAGLLRGGFEELIPELPAWQPFVALIKNDRAVSVCRSVRIVSDAPEAGETHEAGVETLPDFRGQGYATDVTAAWAQRVWAIGALPLYSTSWENKASQAVARKLRLKCYGADFHID